MSDPTPLPCIDLTAIEELRELVDEDTPDFLKDLLRSFLEDAGEHLRSMTTGLESQAVETIMAAAHTLKSSSANLGALQLSDFCRQIETITRNRNLDGVSDLLESAHQEFKRVQKEIQNLPDFD